MPRAYDARAGRRAVFDALIDARTAHGGNRQVLEDQDRSPLTYTALIRAAFALGRKIAGFTAPGERVGVLLPASTGVVITFFSLHSIGRTPTMLNFTSGVRNLKAACATSKLSTILTSKRFLHQGKLDDLIDALKDDYRIVYLEDLRARIGLADKLYALLAAAFPLRFRAPTKPDDIGVILFTSGSFGAPRGVVLSQANLCSNVEQTSAHIDFDPNWVMFNPLPTFHSFGLTAGVLLPLQIGMKAFQYPSPLHVKQIPPLLRETGASVLLTTDTFISQYVRSGEPGDFAGLKFIVCGAERVRDETHELVQRTIGSTPPLIEGFGATECGPVVSVNRPQDNRRGTVGGLLPAIETRLEAVEGIPGGGRLFVRGPNIMSGYLNEAGGIEPPPGGWHDTGDVVSISHDGWLRILGRVKRFAKIGGEMVSLNAAESLAAGLWPDARHAVVALPDGRKGERLVLVTDRLDATQAALITHAQALGAAELTVPRKILHVPEIPVLGTGKTDYVAIQRIAENEA